MKSIVFTPVIYRGEVGWRTLNFISLRASFTSSRFPISFFFFAWVPAKHICPRNSLEPWNTLSEVCSN